MIGPHAAPGRREHAERDAHADGDHHRRQQQFQGRREKEAEFPGHRLPGRERSAEVAAGEPAHVHRVLRRQRPVETEPLAHLLQLLRRGVAARRGAGGVAGQEVGQREGEHADAEQHRHHLQQASSDIGPHHSFHMA